MKHLVIVLLFCLGLSGQTFEVTSVKPHGPAIRGAQGILPACKDGRFVAVTPMILIIRWAYDLDPAQLVELRPQLPDWAQSISGSYDLEATFNGQVSEDQCRKMTQNLLVERFRFVSHWQAGTGTVYSLVVARSGPKMPAVQEGDASSGLNIMMNGKSPQRLSGASPVPPGLTMDEFARFLEGRLMPRAPVINKTGLRGLYKITLAYSPGAAAANKAFADPDLFAALQQQLGLKLEEGRGPVSRFVVDNLEKPTEN